MGMRVHFCKVFQVEYEHSDVLHQDYTDELIDICYHAETGWVSEDECALEIGREELKEIAAKLKGKDELKEFLEKAERGCDQANDFIRFQIC